MGARPPRVARKPCIVSMSMMFLLFCCAGVARSQSQPFTLFELAGSESLPASQQARIDVYLESESYSDLDVVFASVDGLEEAEAVVVDLPDGEQVEIAASSLAQRGPSDYTWIGEPVDGWGRAILVIRGETVTGNLRLAAGSYEVRPVGGTTHVLGRLDDDSLDASEPEDDLADLGSGGYVETCHEDGSVVRVLIAYTPAVAERAFEPRAYIQLVVDEMNQVYVENGVAPRLELALAVQVEYQESTVMETDLARALDPSDLFMDELPPLQSSHAADVVMLMVMFGSAAGKDNAAGLANFLPNADEGYAIVRYGAASSQYSLGHEIGHIQGAHHDGIANPYFPYGQGFNATLAGVPESWRTIMATTGGIRIGYWSNPSGSHPDTGAPLGDASHNNAQVIDLTAARTASFRCGTCVAGACGPEVAISSVGAATGDLLGASVSVDGDLMVAGAPGRAASGQADTGAAYVFARTGDAWVQMAELRASDGTAGDAFGHAVDIAGGVIVVGAPGDDDHGSDSGSAYIFRRDGETWLEEIKLTAELDAGPGQRFGHAVSNHRGSVAVGAPTPTGVGSAYVFLKSVIPPPPGGPTWVREVRLLASDGAAEDRFGVALSLDRYSSTLVIGAPGKDDAGVDSGAAYVFTAVGVASSPWSQQAKLIRLDPAAYDGFGEAVAVWHEQALAGSPYDSAGASQSGSAYVFLRSGTTWGQQVKLAAPLPAAHSRFGAAVALVQDYAMVGAPDHDGAGANAGAAYTFDRPGILPASPNVWLPLERLALNASVGARFGAAVATDRHVVISGAPGADPLPHLTANPPLDSGVIYIDNQY